MVPNPAFSPDPAAKHLPECKRCVKRGDLCLAGPGAACWECNRASARCVDADSDDEREAVVPDDDDSDEPLGMFKRRSGRC